ncbi:MAG: 2-phosphosulfolactate phosphatase [Phycisphaerae bacterium]
MQIQLKWAEHGIKTTKNEIAIVVDILRASTVITRALNCGAEWVMTVPSVKEARILAKEKVALLMGERKCVKIKGFDFGNSPLELNKQKINRKRIIFTSTNFPKALLAANSSPAILIGSILNVTAATEFAYKMAFENHYDICFMLAGTLGKPAHEDLAFVGISGNILKKHNVKIEKSVSKAIDIVNEKGYRQCIFDTYRAQRLSKLGFSNDVAFACKKDLYDIAPIGSECNENIIFTRQLPAID